LETADLVTVLIEPCIKLYAPDAEKNVKYLLSLQTTSLFFAKTVSIVMKDLNQEGRIIEMTGLQDLRTDRCIVRSVQIAVKIARYLFGLPKEEMFFAQTVLKKSENSRKYESPRYSADVNRPNQNQTPNYNAQFELLNAKMDKILAYLAAKPVEPAPLESEIDEKVIDEIADDVQEDAMIDTKTAAPLEKKAAKAKKTKSAKNK
jgi:hypothetical protein